MKHEKTIHQLSNLSSCEQYDVARAAVEMLKDMIQNGDTKNAVLMAERLGLSNIAEDLWSGK